jgi:hypothetical protein
MHVFRLRVLFKNAHIFEHDVCVCVCVCVCEKEREREERSERERDAEYVQNCYFYF